jgi:hypothetical protein
MPPGPNATEEMPLLAGSVRVAIRCLVVVSHRWVLPWPAASLSPVARMPPGPNATDWTPPLTGSGSVTVSVPLGMLAGCLPAEWLLAGRLPA